MKDNRLARFTCVVVTLGAVVSAQADDVVPLDETDLFHEIPIITTATRLPQDIMSSPVAITYIDADMIAASGATEITQLLKLVPGFLPYYVTGNQFGVTNRGLTYQFPGDLDVTLDGRSIYVPLFSTVEWSSIGIGINDIEYIEVVRSSNAPAYGSNAFLGAINIVTNNPKKDPGLHVTLTAGDIKTRNADISYTGSAGDIRFNGAIHYRSNEGFPSLANNPDDTVRDITEYEDGNEAIKGRFEALYTPNLTNTFQFHVGVGKSDVNRAEGAFSDDISGHNHWQFKDNYQMFRWDHIINDRNDFQLQVHHNRLELRESRELGYMSELLGVEPEIIPTLFNGHPDEYIVTGVGEAISDKTELEGYFRLLPGASHRMVVGATVRHERIKSEFLLGHDKWIDETYLRQFGNWEWEITPKITSNLGWTLEHNDIVGTFSSPRLALTIKPLPQHSLRIGVTRGNRSPSLLEAKQFQMVTFSDGEIIDADVIGDEDIEQSTIEEYEIGYVGQYLERRLTVDARIFEAEVEDAIEVIKTDFPQDPFDGTIAIRANNTFWDSRGFEAQLKYFSGNSLVALQYAYTDYSGKQIKRLEPLKISKFDNLNSPRHIASCLIQQRFPGKIDASVMWSYRSAIKWEEGDSMDSHDRLDLRLARDFEFQSNTARLEFLAHNVLGDYEEYIDENVFETRYFLRLTLQFD